jgi:hypothetical protein
VAGIIFLFIVLLWLMFVLFLTVAITKRIIGLKAVFVGIALFVCLFPLPLLDEIIGAQQFSKLCKQNASVKVASGVKKGDRVYLMEASGPPHSEGIVRVVQ